MSKLSRELCLPACLGIGVALYVYSALLVPRVDGSAATIGKAAQAPVQTEPQQLEPQPFEPQPAKLAPLKPKLKPALLKPASSQTPDVTGAIGPRAATGPQAGAGLRPDPRAAGEQLPKVPGIRVASLAPQAVPVQTPDATRWSPAVGYAPIAKSGKPVMADRQVGPQRARKYRTVRRPYRRHTNFRVVIGVGPRW